MRGRHDMGNIRAYGLQEGGDQLLYRSESM